MSQWNMALHLVVAVGLGSDRGPAVHEPAHRRVPPAQGLHQAGHQLPQPAPRRPGQQQERLTAVNPLPPGSRHVTGSHSSTPLGGPGREPGCRLGVPRMRARSSQTDSAGMGNSPALGPEIISWPGTDDMEAVMILLFNWHQAPQATTERLRS
jgi:hypothetical protein